MQTKEKKILNLFEITDTAGVIKRTVEILISPFKALLTEAELKSCLPTDEDLVPIIQAIVPVYAEILTDQEIDDWLQFSSSETGKSITKKLPELNTRTQEVAGKAFAAILEKRPTP